MTVDLLRLLGLRNLTACLTICDLRSTEWKFVMEYSCFPYEIGLTAKQTRLWNDFNFEMFSISKYHFL